MRIFIIISLIIGSLIVVVPKKVYITVTNVTRIEGILTKLNYDQTLVFAKELEVSTLPLNDLVVRSTIGKHALEIILPEHSNVEVISIISVFNNYIDFELTQDENDNVDIQIRKSYFPLWYQ